MNRLEWCGNIGKECRFFSLVPGESEEIVPLRVYRCLDCQTGVWQAPPHPSGPAVGGPVVFPDAPCTVDSRRYQ